MAFTPINNFKQCYVACSEEKIRYGQCACHNRTIDTEVESHKHEKLSDIKIEMIRKLVSRERPYLNNNFEIKHFNEFNKGVIIEIRYDDYYEDTLEFSFLDICAFIYENK